MWYPVSSCLSTHMGSGQHGKNHVCTTGSGQDQLFLFFTYRASIDEALAYGSEDKDEKKSSTLKKFADW